jgi:antitoxin PrlF
MTVRVTDTGEVTLPKAVQDLMGIGPGSVVDFERAPDGRIVLVKVDLTEMTNRLEKLRGSAGMGLSNDQIMDLTRGED